MQIVYLFIKTDTRQRPSKEKGVYFAAESFLHCDNLYKKVLQCVCISLIRTFAFRHRQDMHRQNGDKNIDKPA